MTLQHDDGFSINMTEKALFADYRTIGMETRVLVIHPETDELFSFEGNFQIIDVIVANSQDEVSTELPIATRYSLSDAYPNPFNPTTTMELTMPLAGDMNVEIYNLLGQTVSVLSSGYKEAGTYNLTWDATDIASGTYFVRVQSDDFTKVQKITLMK
jgi:hypothetical protein